MTEEPFPDAIQEAIDSFCPGEEFYRTYEAIQWALFHGESVALSLGEKSELVIRYPRTDPYGWNARTVVTSALAAERPLNIQNLSTRLMFQPCQ